MTTDLRALLSEIAGDCRVAYGVTEENYRAFCRNGAMGKMPSSTWPEHCQRRLEQIEKAIAALDAQSVQSAYNPGETLSNGAQAGGWLTVAEATPAVGQLVAVHSPGAMICDVWPARYTRFGNFDAGGGWFEQDEITHWMPLPAGPVEGGGT